MIVTAALAWWDERPEDLRRCVLGVATVADRIVAVDGAYRRYPEATIRSAPEQAAAIRDAAQEAGLEPIIIIPDELWAGQLAKRTSLLQKAAEGSDWVAVVDTDWVVSGDREKVRAELQGLKYDVVRVPLCTPAENDKPIATGWHAQQLGGCYYHPHLFRALPEFKVEKRHGWYSALKRGRRIWVSKGTQHGGLPYHQVQAPYRIDHMFTERTEQQILAGRAFCNDRVMVVRRTGQEDDVPGLPPPVFDFETVPYVVQRRASGIRRLALNKR